MSNSEAPLPSIELEKQDEVGLFSPVADGSVSLAFMVIAFLAFESTYAVAGLTYPSPINSTVLDYPIFPRNSRPIVRTELHVEHLTSRHRFLRIDASIVRYPGGESQLSSIDVNEAFALRRDGLTVRRVDGFLPNVTFSFPPEDHTSSEINIGVIPISEFDSLSLNLTLFADLHLCKAIRFKYSFADPRFDRFQRLVRLILSGCALGAFVSFFIFLKFNLHLHFQYISVILGLTACFATNPLSAIFPSKLTDFFSPFLLILFLSIFRFLVFHFLDSIVIPRRRCRLVLLYLSLVVIYGLVETFVALGPSAVDSILVNDAQPQRGSGEAFLEICHILYSIFVFVGFAFAFAKAGTQRARVSRFGPFALASAAATIIAEVFIKRSRSAKVSGFSVLIYHSSHVLAAIAYLLLLPPAVLEYENIEDDFDGDQNRTLAVDIADS
jgi:hypothetical protein